MTINGVNNANAAVQVSVANNSAESVEKSCYNGGSIFGQQNQYANPCANPYGQQAVYPNAFGSPTTYTNSIIPYDVPLPFLPGLVGATRCVDLGMLTAQGSQSPYFNASARGPQWEAAVNSGCCWA